MRRFLLVPVASLVVLVAACGNDASGPVAAPLTGPATTRPASAVLDAGTTEAPATTEAPTTSSSDVATSSTLASTTTTTTRSGGAASSTTVLIPAGTSAADKAWCAQAAPISTALNNLFGLTPAQLESLVNQANALVPTAPDALKPLLTILHDVGAKFLAAVKAGKATISVEGITIWANANLTQQQQAEFLGAVASVNSYLSRTC
jgi:hypothetical protein